MDAAATPDGAFLYVQTGGNGIVDEFSVGTGGSLTSVGSVTVAGAARRRGHRRFLTAAHHARRAGTRPARRRATIKEA